MSRKIFSLFYVKFVTVFLFNWIRENLENTWGNVHKILDKLQVNIGKTPVKLLTENYQSFP